MSACTVAKHFWNSNSEGITQFAGIQSPQHTSATFAVIQIEIKISPRTTYNQSIYCPHHLPANFVVKFHKSNRRQSPHTLQAYKASSIRLHYLWSYRLKLKFRPGPHLVIPYTAHTIRLDQASTTRLGNNEGFRSVITVN